MLLACRHTFAVAGQMNVALPTTTVAFKKCIRSPLQSMPVCLLQLAPPPPVPPTFIIKMSSLFAVQINILLWLHAAAWDLVITTTTTMQLMIYFNEVRVRTTRWIEVSRFVRAVRAVLNDILKIIAEYSGTLPDIFSRVLKNTCYRFDDG